MKRMLDVGLSHDLKERCFLSIFAAMNSPWWSDLASWLQQPETSVGVLAEEQNGGSVKERLIVSRKEKRASSRAVCRASDSHERSITRHLASQLLAQHWWFTRWCMLPRDDLTSHTQAHSLFWGPAHSLQLPSGQVWMYHWWHWNSSFFFPNWLLF